jgi:hypothetical protein
MFPPPGLKYVGLKLIGLLLLTTCLSNAQTPPPASPSQDHWLSHAPMHIPPGPGDRPMAEGPAYFVDALKGDDQNPGSEKSPFKTLKKSLSVLQPGGTLYLRAGVYYEPLYVALRGTADKPITIRGYRGERAVIDASLPEFSQDPANAWDPVAGSDGEYRSRRTYPNLRDIIGSFGDSMIGLQTYWHLQDLCATNENYSTAGKLDPNKDTKVGDTDIDPIYVGPGIFYDAQTGYIHARLAPTHLPGIDNYNGESDPRKLPLVLSAFRTEPLHVDQGEHLKFQDLVIRGGGYNTVILDRCTDIDFDNITIHAGTYGIMVRNTTKLRFWKSGIYGNLGGPWTFRSDNSLRSRPGRNTRDIARLTAHALWVLDTGGEYSVYSMPYNDDWEIAYSTFVDSHDGLYLGGVNLKFHHNLMDNMQDDGIYLTPMYTRYKDEPKLDIYDNIFSRCLSTLAFGGPEETTDTVYVHNNIFDLRGMIKYARPTVGLPPPKPSLGRAQGDHSRVPWDTLMMYNNTFVMGDASDPLMGWTNNVNPDRPRRLFDNIFLHLQPLGSYAIGKAAASSKKKATTKVAAPAEMPNFVEDGNIFWSPVNGEKVAANFFDAFRASDAFTKSKELYPDGSSTHSIVADPKFTRVDVDFVHANDYSLQAGSPAIGAGVPIPTDWPEANLAKDGAKPDIGAVPFGSPMLKVGPSAAPQ